MKELPRAPAEDQQQQHSLDLAGAAQKSNGPRVTIWGSTRQAQWTTSTSSQLSMQTARIRKGIHHQLTESACSACFRCVAIPHGLSSSPTLSQAASYQSCLSVILSLIKHCSVSATLSLSHTKPVFFAAWLSQTCLSLSASLTLSSLFVHVSLSLHTMQNSLKSETACAPAGHIDHLF